MNSEDLAARIAAHLQGAVPVRPELDTPYRSQGKPWGTTVSVDANALQGQGVVLALPSGYVFRHIDAWVIQTSTYGPPSYVRLILDNIEQPQNCAHRGPDDITPATPGVCDPAGASVVLSSGARAVWRDIEDAQLDRILLFNTLTSSGGATYAIVGVSATIVLSKARTAERAGR